MDTRRRARIFGAVLLILVGAWLLLIQIFPDLRIFDSLNLSWPWIIIGVGILLFILGLAGGVPGMSVPAAIVAGIGGILYYQNETGDWTSWAYLWTLIPGFVGVGTIVAGLLGDNTRKSIMDGLTSIFISAILFIIFASWWGDMDILGPYWPVLIILFGVWILIRGLIRPRKSIE